MLMWAGPSGAHSGTARGLSGGNASHGTPSPARCPSASISPTSCRQGLTIGFGLRGH